MRLSVGCPMWSLPAWSGRFLRHPLPPRERLRAYAAWCDAVEGNTTFYATPARDTVATWAAQTSPDFRFLLKVPRTVTHERRLVDVDAPMRAFLTAIEPLGPRVHALWTQLPPTFGPADLGSLAVFLRRLAPRGYRLAVEPRHPAFFEEGEAARRFEELLVAAGAEWVTFDTTVFFASPPSSDAEREAWSQKPRLPRRVVALTDSPVVRYIGRDDVEATAAGWQPWVAVVADWLREGRSPTVFVHTPDNAEGLVLARRFHEEVRALVPELAALPEPEPVEPPTLF